MTNAFLLLHGWGGNKPDHWQEHLARELAAEGQDVHYPKMSNPTAPDPKAWMDTLHAALAAIPQDANLTVLAHSMGAINWIRHAAMAQSMGESRPGPQAARVLLVAPPYVVREVPPLDLAGAVGFFPPPLDKAGIALAARETTLVESDTDDYATFDQASAYADALGIAIEKLAGAGHISPYYGYGAWPWVRDWALGRASLPPQPNELRRSKLRGIRTIAAVSRRREVAA